MIRLTIFLNKQYGTNIEFAIPFSSVMHDLKILHTNIYKP